MPGFEVQSTFQLPTASALQREADVKRQMYAANARGPQQAQQPQRQTQDHHPVNPNPQAHPHPIQDHPPVAAARQEASMPGRVYPAQQGYDEATLLQAAALARVQLQQQAALQQAQQLAPSYAPQPQQYAPVARPQVCPPWPCLSPLPGGHLSLVSLDS